MKSFKSCAAIIVLGVSATVLSFGAMFGFAKSADASLMGQTITSSAGGSLVCDVPSNTVTAGVEFAVSPGGRFVDVDVGDQSVLVSNLGPIRGFGNFSFTISLGDLFWSNDPLASIIGITNFSSSVSGLIETDITTGPNSLTIDINNTSWVRFASVSFDLVTTHSVPEPTTLALFATSLAGLGFMMRRRRRVV